jgi:plasmid replication initiation protein
VTIRAADFAAQFGTEMGSVYGQLKDAMDTLFERHVVLHDTDPETKKPRVTKTRWISQASYVDGAGHIQFIFSPAVIPFITRLGEEGEFTSYRLEKIGRMTSVYAVRLYEMLVQHLTIGKRDLEVKWLRETLCLTGEYPRVADFKKWVIDIAIAQINEHSDIDVSYTQRKTGRSITHLDFKIKLKASVKLRVKKSTLSTGGSDSRAHPGESQHAFEKRILEEKYGQKKIDI